MHEKNNLYIKNILENLCFFHYMNIMLNKQVVQEFQRMRGLLEQWTQKISQYHISTV